MPTLSGPKSRLSASDGPSHMEPTRVAPNGHPQARHGDAEDRRREGYLDYRLQRSLATTTAAESLLSRTRHVKRNVKRWRGGQMMLRWVATGVLEAVKGFRRLKGCGDMPRLVSALRALDQRLRLGVSEVNVA